MTDESRTKPLFQI